MLSKPDTISINYFFEEENSQFKSQNKIQTKLRHLVQFTVDFLRLREGIGEGQTHISVLATQAKNKGVISDDEIDLLKKAVRTIL